MKNCSSLSLILISHASVLDFAASRLSISSNITSVTVLKDTPVDLVTSKNKTQNKMNTYRGRSSVFFFPFYGEIFPHCFWTWEKFPPEGGKFFWGGEKFFGVGKFFLDWGNFLEWENFFEVGKFFWSGKFFWAGKIFGSLNTGCFSLMVNYHNLTQKLAFFTN